MWTFNYDQTIFATGLTFAEALSLLATLPAGQVQYDPLR